MNKTLHSILLGALWLITIACVVLGYGVVRGTLSAQHLIKEGYNMSAGQSTYVMGIIIASYNAMPVELNPSANLSAWLITQYNLCDSYLKSQTCPYFKVLGPGPGAWVFNATTMPNLQK